ncbi:MAG: hypothetical protein R6V50_00205 [Thermoplasmatota archaeon]
MKTYVTILFNSEGAAPSQIKNNLLNMGFKAAKGNYDFIYEWPTSVHDINELVFFADKVFAALKGSKVMFSIETI